MKCQQCSRPALMSWGPEGLPLCLSCSTQYQALIADQFDQAARAVHFAQSQIGAVLGYYTPPAPPAPRKTVIHAPTTNNINVANAGVVNSGTINSIGYAVGSLGQAGATGAAEAIKALTEAVLSDPSLSPEKKATVLEQLSVVAEEATAPLERRRKAAVMASLRDIGTVVSISSGLAALAEKLLPIIQAHFG